MPKRGHPYPTVIGALLIAAGWGVVAGDGSRSPESDLAAPGAPLYQYAVSESVRTLMSKEEQAELGAAGRPPSPGPDYYWCENCKTYHKRQNPASPGEPAGARSPGAAPATPRQPDAGAGARSPSPGADYYWCEQCKSYHQRQAVPNHSGAAVPGSSAAPVRRGSPPAEVVAGSRPPSPGEGYYWCENCKSYHLRQTSAQQSGASPATLHSNAASPAVGTVASQALGQSYYCEQCKTYHRRQPVAQQPAVDTNRFGGGVSNSPNWSPLFGPAGAER